MIEKEIFDYLDNNKIIDVAGLVATGKTCMAAILTKYYDKNTMYYDMNSSKTFFRWFEVLKLNKPKNILTHKQILNSNGLKTHLKRIDAFSELELQRKYDMLYWMI